MATFVSQCFGLSTRRLSLSGKRRLARRLDFSASFDTDLIV